MLLLKNAGNDTLFPWICKGIDITSQRRLRIDITKINNDLADKIIDKDILYGVDLNLLMPYLSNRELSLIDNCIIVVFKSSDQSIIFGLLILINAFSEENQRYFNCLEPFVKKISSKFESTLSGLFSFSQKELFISNNPIEAINSLIESQLQIKNITCILIDLSEVINMILSEYLICDSFLIRKELTSIVLSFVKSSGKLFHIKEDSYLIIVIGSISAKTIIHQLTIALEKAFQPDSKDFNFTYHAKYYPQDGKNAKELLHNLV